MSEHEPSVNLLNMCLKELEISAGMIFCEFYRKRVGDVVNFALYLDIPNYEKPYELPVGHIEGHSDETMERAMSHQVGLRLEKLLETKAAKLGGLYFSGAMLLGPSELGYYGRTFHYEMLDSVEEIIDKSDSRSIDNLILPEE